MKSFVRQVDGRHGISLHRLIKLLHNLKVKHHIRRITMSRLAGSSMKYQLEVDINESREEQQSAREKSLRTT